MCAHGSGSTCCGAEDCTGHHALIITVLKTCHFIIKGRIGSTVYHALIIGGHCQGSLAYCQCTWNFCNVIVGSQGTGDSDGMCCLLYTSDAADEEDSVGLGG